MTRLTRTILLGGAAALLLTGCDRGASLSEIEARERATRLYSNAMDDLQAGRVDAAIRGFEHVLVQEPGNYSAHFQLATLLQDIRKDYIGAISHYRSYLLFRPASDKATVASDRMRQCDTLLGAEYLRKAGGSASVHLSSDNEKLTAERDALAAQVRRLEGELAAAQQKAEAPTRENARQRSLLAKLGDEALPASAAASPNASAKEALAELRALEAEERRRRLRPTDAELLDEDDAPAPAAGRAAGDLRLLIADAERGGKPPAAQPAPAGAPAANARPRALDDLLAPGKKKNAAAAQRPETYVVQEGDTLFKISTRFYGSSHKWRAIREANKATIPPDGRVRAGQTITLP